MKQHTKALALGGVLAAVAVVIMAMGTMIPVATFVCPMFCMMILQLVVMRCGVRMAWAWYGAVTVLSLLFAPDREAAAVFAFLGYYPIVKPALDRLKWGIILKLVLFNTAIVLMYWILMNLFGMDAIAQEYQELGTVMTAVLLVLGNVTFLLLDRILGRKWKRRTHG